MNTLVGLFVTAVVFFALFKLLGPPLSIGKSRKKRAGTRKVKPKSQRDLEIAKLKGKQRRLRAELRRVQEELQDISL
ncbi:hypothetical protein LLE49_16055 [Alicyclobacillus tolerans]|uniref:hypothetical protein n=1 Tax=Alicyclobacillus tolerans TaxID=90970 RepID=UPI001F2E7327|nr:hypothetical protein [Alicyclobacillus tolerans]MCF8566239.1 hypothetical protein [Alicyclobacillus tolerans]